MDIQTITGEIGKGGLYEIDLDVSVDGATKIWFTAKQHTADIDTDAILRKGMNLGAGEPTGIAIVDASAGKVQLQIDESDWPASFSDEALVFDVQVRRAGDTAPYTAVRGVMRLGNAVTVDND